MTPKPSCENAERSPQKYRQSPPPSCEIPHYPIRCLLLSVPFPQFLPYPDGSFGESTTIMAGTGRKRKRYNTFRASSNPLPPKRSLRRHIKTSVSAIQRCNEPKSTTDSESRSSQDESFVLTADKNLEVTFQDHRSTDYLDLLEENSGVEISDELPSFPVHETSLQHGHKFQDLEFVYIDQDETDSQMNDYEVVSEITATDANKSDTPIEDDDPPVYPSCPLLTAVGKCLTYHDISNSA